MGLDASVHCDCFETGRLREPPPLGCNVRVAADGSLDCGTDDLQVQLAFDKWQRDRACEHELGVLLHHHIGNIGLVAALRGELQHHPEKFPLILSKVLYSGTHCADFLSIEDVERIRREIQALSDFKSPDPEMREFIRNFASQMTELAACSLRVNKPIAF